MIKNQRGGFDERANPATSVWGPMMNTPSRRLVLSLLALPLLGGCGEAPERVPSEPATSAQAPAAPMDQSTAGAQGAAASPAAFTIDVSLSPQATARLANGEGIVVNTMIAGPATAARQGDADEMGEIDLGTEQVTADGRPGPIQITGASFQPDRLSWIEGSPMVTVNIYTARRTDPDNLITCDPFISGPLAEIAGRVHRVQCRLISEG